MIQRHEPKTPASPVWSRVRAPEVIEPPSSAWTKKGRIFVISSIGEMQLPKGADGPAIGATWVVSISLAGGSSKRVSDRDVRKVLRDFDIVGAEEDNHEPGKSRKFFLPVNPKFRGLCECKEDETTIVEPDGYRWQAKTDDPNTCRACLWSHRTGTLCPVHQRNAARCAACGGLFTAAGTELGDFMSSGRALCVECSAKLQEYEQKSG